MTGEAIRVYAILRVAFGDRRHCRIRTTEDDQGVIRLRVNEVFEPVTVLDAARILPSIVGYDEDVEQARARRCDQQEWEARLSFYREFVSDGALAERIIAEACQGVRDQFDHDTQLLHPHQRDHVHRQVRSAA